MTFRNALFILLLAPSLVTGAELGKLTVLSAVGEPLRAEIEILSVQANEAASLSARIPSHEAFWRANIEPPALLRTLRATVERRPNGRYVAVLRSTDPIVEPFVDILVELDSGSGAKQREYTFLVEERTTQTARSTPALRAPPIDPPATLPEDTRTSSRLPLTRGAAASSDTYTVRAGDTLASIARSKQGGEVTSEQMMVALYHANEAIFVSSNMNRLPAGAVLTVPDADTARATNPTEARNIVRAHRAEFDAYRNRLASSVPDSQGTVPGSTTVPIGTNSQPPAAPPPKVSPEDRLRLSRGDESKAGSAAGTAHEDDTVAMQQALNDARDRLATLERNLDDMRRLLALQSEQLAQVREFARTSAPSSRDAAGREVPLRPPAAGGIATSSAPLVNVPANQQSGAMHFARNYWPWFATAFFVAFLAWIAMPVKTARLWRKQRRRRARQARRAAEVMA
jgi:pilus assembly protein FimV